MPRPARKHSTAVVHAMRSLTVPKTLVEPVLNGVVGRESKSYPGYPYSDVNKNSGITWDGLKKVMTSST
jgi:cytochrome c2